VLDVVESVHRAADTGTVVALSTSCERPEPVRAPVDLAR